MKRTSVCAVIVGEEILLLERAKTDRISGFSLPGGKNDPGETDLDAAKRELQEETSIVLTNDPVYITDIVSATGEYIVAIHYTKLDKKPDIKLSPSEHTSYVWTPFEKAYSFPLAGNTSKFIQAIEIISNNEY